MNYNFRATDHDVKKNENCIDSRNRTQAIFQIIFSWIHKRFVLESRCAQIQNLLNWFGHPYILINILWSRLW